MLSFTFKGKIRRYIDVELFWVHFIYRHRVFLADVVAFVVVALHRTEKKVVYRCLYIFNGMCILMLTMNEDSKQKKQEFFITREFDMTTSFKIISSTYDKHVFFPCLS